MGPPASAGVAHPLRLCCCRVRKIASSEIWVPQCYYPLCGAVLANSSIPRQAYVNHAPSIAFALVRSNTHAEAIASQPRHHHLSSNVCAQRRANSMIRRMLYANRAGRPSFVRTIGIHSHALGSPTFRVCLTTYLAPLPLLVVHAQRELMGPRAHLVPSVLCVPNQY